MKPPTPLVGHLRCFPFSEALGIFEAVGLGLAPSLFVGHHAVLRRNALEHTKCMHHHWCTFAGSLPILRHHLTA